MKKIIKHIIGIFAKVIIFLLSSINSGRYFIDELNNNLFIKRQTIKHKDLEFNFHVPNRLNYFRVNTFSSKEPETLNWIDTFTTQSIFWDIGANIGLYSCYAAKRTNSKVYAFEPSVFNLELLAKNIYINSLSDKITIIPFPVSDNLDIKTFYMSSTERGGALSTFGKKINHDGSSMTNIFRYKMIGMSMDDCIKLLNFEKPNYIKIDVDGIEYLILKGSTSALKNVESILVEVNKNFDKQSKDIEKYLTQSGFKLDQKSYPNQIWRK